MQACVLTPAIKACCCAVQARETNARLRKELQLLQQRRDIVVDALGGPA